MVLVILTADQILRTGLLVVGFSDRRIQNVERAKSLERFRTAYGSNPIVYAQIWEDLQTTEIPEARIDKKTMDLNYFLMWLRFLKRYPTECELAGTFKICEKTARTWAWFYAQKIQALKGQKVSSLLLHIFV